MVARHTASTLKNAAPQSGPLHLAIGMFDGVHLGHQAVIEAAIHAARQSKGVSGVLTFHPHPSRLFRPDDPTMMLMRPEEKVSFLRELGVNLVIMQPFTRAFARVEAVDFLAMLKRHLPGLATVYVGENFHFGRGRAGNVATLVRSARALDVSVVSVPRLRHNGRAVSSTRIRGLLASGDVAEAASLLGYTYSCAGMVVRGNRLGRKLGFPTLNIPWSPEVRPAFGVYVIRLRVGVSRSWLKGVANYGVRPTITHKPGAKPLIEVHLFNGKHAPSAGAQIRVEWLEFLRRERKFSSVTALRSQIARDCTAAKVFFRRK